LSNNATICSYPRFCQANPLGADQTTASLDTLCATTNPGAAVDVPTGVGFCMYIRRDCLSAVGLFDVANFGKGYGEENDFCRRAHANGWRNLLALDTFVLHAGGVSFGDSKSARELAAMETLRRLHPDYEAEVMRFIQADPAQPYRHAIDLARLKTSPLPKILAVTHDRAGGTLRHVRELAQALQTQAHFLVLSPAPAGRATLELPGQFEGMRLEFVIETQFDDLVLLLKSIDVSLVHYHHLLGHHPRVQALPTCLGVPFDFTAHDHYSQCPQISLTDATNRYCGETGNGEGPCHTCLQRSPAPGGVNIDTWRANHHVFLRRSRHILAPSQDTAQRMQRFLPTANIKVAPHTDLTPNAPLAVPAPRATRNPDAALKVVVLGALSTIKGADVLEQVATLAAAAKAPLEFHLVGYAYRSLKTRPRTYLTVHGEYTEDDLPGMLEWLKPDLVWFPALWPETYSYTLSACLKLGLPVVAPNLGAFPERLAQRAWSWVQPWDQPATDWLAFFQHLQSAHFANGVPPTPPQLEPGTGLTATGWSYASHYLPLPKSASPQSAPTPLPSPQWLHTHRPGQVQPGLQGLATGMRRRALSGLVRLRSAPVLRPLAQAIPLRWQTRVKSWLVR
jgi:glycosyltransferase involved in cell wall biosynthesis